MPRRWQWDFEAPSAPTGSSPAPAPAQLPLPEGGPGVDRNEAGSAGLASRLPSRASYRRRRGAALIVLAGVVALVIALLTGAGGGKPGSAARVRAEMARDHAARAHPPAGGSDLGAAVASVLAYTPFVREGGSRGHDIALTFDDGPGPYTPALLSVLERYHVHATFFVIGKMLRYFSASTVREIEDGDVIGDHTETHPLMAGLSADEQYEEMFEQIIRVESLGAKRPTLFRPPYGSFDATTFKELKRLHLLMVLWSVDTSDYKQPGVAAIVESALAGAHPGAIILMHDGGGVRTETIAALPLIITRLRARGYQLVTVPQLLAEDPPPAGQPLPSSLAGD